MYVAIVPYATVNKGNSDSLTENINGYQLHA